MTEIPNWLGFLSLIGFVLIIILVIKCYKMLFVEKKQDD